MKRDWIVKTRCNLDMEFVEGSIAAWLYCSISLQQCIRVIDCFCFFKWSKNSTSKKHVLSWKFLSSATMKFVECVIGYTLSLMEVIFVNTGWRKYSRTIIFVCQRWVMPTVIRIFSYASVKIRLILFLVVHVSYIDSI